jgi:hypothetical protein
LWKEVRKRRIYIPTRGIREGRKKQSNEGWLKREGRRKGYMQTEGRTEGHKQMNGGIYTNESKKKRKISTTKKGGGKHV